MADDKEAFLSRWSRRKQEQPPERKAEVAPASAATPPLPPVDQLTPDSDFTGFMNPKVEDALRRVALKKLFSDPHFNIPDPFEPFSGDWNVGEPMSEKMLASLEQMKHMLRKLPEEKPSVKESETQAKPEPEPDEPGRKDA